MINERQKFNSQKGLTLIEGLIYVFAAALLATVLVTLLLGMVRGFKSFSSARSISHSATVTLDRLVREIRQATSIDLGGSTLGTNPGHLVLQTIDENEVETTLEFYVNNGVLMIKEGASQAASSTSEYLTVTNLVFRRINTSHSEAVKIELTLSDPRTNPAKTEKFYASAVLRGSY